MIEQVVNYINEISGGNQTLAAAIMLSLTGFLGLLYHTLPKVIYSFLKRQLLTTLTINNSTWDGQENYDLITNHIFEKCNSERIKHFTLASIYRSLEKRSLLFLNIGYGKNLFWYDNIPILVDRVLLDNKDGGSAGKLLEECTISTLVSNRFIFNTIIKAIQPPKDNSKLQIMQYIDKQWRTIHKEKKSSIDSLALNPEIKEKFIKELTHFTEGGPEEFSSINLAYKLTYVLHGYSGSGKTALIKALASMFDFNVLFINLNCTSDDLLREAFATIPEKSMVLVEDFDTFKVMGNRKENKIVSDEIEDVLNISLSGVLNALDGICALNNVIVFMTTNHLEKIDSAVIRSGRVDDIIELPKIRKEVVQDYFEKLYPDINKGITQAKYCDMMGCEINEVISSGKKNTSKVIHVLNEKYYENERNAVPLHTNLIEGFKK